ncbi:MAG: DnaJ domain-containing protein [Candidatus Competibacteraceae bacterium]|nr:DnaJ domain-containing protein [Candidatus Competibacteraceae bacterium]
MTDPGLDIFELALACYRTPLAYQNRMSLAAPLPRDMNRLLWLANGSPETLEGAVRQTGAKADDLCAAARFLVQQLCFARGASQYRILGLEPGATAEQIKEHHRLLMRLFHPDRVGGESWTDHFASRVNEAWTVLSRMQPRAACDARGSQAPTQGVVSTAAVSTAPPPAGPVRARHPRHSVIFRAQSAVPRRWMPTLVLGGFALLAVLAVWSIYETRPHVATPDVLDRPAPAAEVEPESSLAEPADRSAITTLLVAPDWQALGRRERQARRQASESHAAREQLEQVHRERLATDVALLEQIRAERTRLEERMRAEQLRAERTWSERLATEQAKLEQLRAEQVQAERARNERLVAERAKLERLKAEQAEVERARDERLAAERAKLERLKAEQKKAERLAEALRTERERLEQNRLRARAAPARLARSDPPPVRPVVASAGETRPVAIVPDAGELSVQELDGLIERYTNAYRRGDLDSVMALFAPSVRGKGGAGRNRIRQDYGTLFRTASVQRMELHDLRWRRGDESARAVGHYELWLQRRDNSASIQMTGKISFEVRKLDGQPSIVAIDYDWRGN